MYCTSGKKHAKICSADKGQKSVRFRPKKPIYHASDEEKARLALDRVTEKWTAKYPNFMKRWYDNWDAITPNFLSSHRMSERLFTRQMLSKSESTYRKLNRQRSVFPSDTALLKVLYLATFEATKKVDYEHSELGTGLRRTQHYV